MDLAHSLGCKVYEQYCSDLNAHGIKCLPALAVVLEDEIDTGFKFVYD